MSIWMIFLILDIICGNNNSQSYDDFYLTDYSYEDCDFG